MLITKHSADELKTSGIYKITVEEKVQQQVNHIKDFYLK